MDKQNGHISHYKLYYVEASRPDKEAIEMMLKSPLQDGTEFKLEELKKWTQYRIWLLAGTVVGDGPPSESITVRTQEDGTYLFLDSGPAPSDNSLSLPLLTATAFVFLCVLPISILICPSVSSFLDLSSPVHFGLLLEPLRLAKLKLLMP